MALKNKKICFSAGFVVILAGLFFISNTQSVSAADCENNSANLSFSSFLNPLLSFAETIVKGFGYNVALAESPSTDPSTDPDSCGEDIVVCSGGAPSVTINWSAAPFDLWGMYSYCFYRLTVGGTTYDISSSPFGLGCRGDRVNGNPATDNTYTVASGLASNTNYSWTVEAHYYTGPASPPLGVPSASLGVTDQPSGSFDTPNCAPPFNNPPSANNLSVTQPDYCIITWPTAIFSWQFTDPDGDTQSAYQIQVDNNSNFSSPEVDTGKILSSSNFYATLPGALSYNTTYYWQLKVWDSKDLSSSWISGPSFTIPLHQYPSINFSWTPQIPLINENTQFTDQSTVYGGSTKSSWDWLFQNGNPASSAQQNPLVKFLSTGAKSVTLRVTDSDGFSCQAQKTINSQLPLPEWKEISPF